MTPEGTQILQPSFAAATIAQTFAKHDNMEQGGGMLYAITLQLFCRAYTHQ
jgi:hypothetical protein